MATSHRVIQGSNAQAVVDGKPHVLVAAEVFGDGQDGQHLSLVRPRLQEHMEARGQSKDYFEGKQFLAESHDFRETNLQTCDGRVEGKRSLTLCILIQKLYTKRIGRLKIWKYGGAHGSCFGFIKHALE